MLTRKLIKGGLTSPATFTPPRKQPMLTLPLSTLLIHLDMYQNMPLPMRTLSMPMFCQLVILL